MVLLLALAGTELLAAIGAATHHAGLPDTLGLAYASAVRFAMVTTLALGTPAQRRAAHNQVNTEALRPVTNQPGCPTTEIDGLQWLFAIM